MERNTLHSRVEALQEVLTPAYVASQVQILLRQGQDVGGGINATRLIRHWLGDVARTDAQITWAYMRLKPALRAALDEVPSLYYFEGD